MRRTTCLRCEKEGKTTELVQTPRGGVCPTHDAVFIESLKKNARLILGIPEIRADQRGRPKPRPSY